MSRVETKSDWKTTDSTGLMSCFSTVLPNAAYLLAAALPVNVLITDKQLASSKEGINQPISQATFCLSSFSPMVNVHSAKQQILWDNKTSIEEPICEELRRMLLMSGISCFLDWSQGCQGNVYRLPSDLLSNSMLSVSTNAAPAQEALLFCWVHTLASFHWAQLSSFTVFLCFQALNKYLQRQQKNESAVLPRVLKGEFVSDVNMDFERNFSKSNNEESRGALGCFV